MAAEPLILALITQLVRRGDLDADDIDQMATGLEEEGEGEAAHLCRAAFVEAHAPSASDWNAERARARMRLIKTDGGNETA